jgi:molybdopterin synthase sulfur carrier subunit
MVTLGSPDTGTTILFFGRLADQVGRQCKVLLPAGGCTIGDLRHRLGQQDGYAALAEGTVLASADQRIVPDDHLVRSGQEIAFFSPLSGG